MNPEAKLRIEIATYEAQRSDFLENHADEFVLIKGSDVVGFFADESDAIAEGHRRFVDQGFLVRRVAESEKPILLTSLNVGIAR